jgi:antitoxin FitA
MAMLTIRNLDEALKARLRVRAAQSNHSMEEEARRILARALQGAAGPASDLSQRVRARFAPLGDVVLAVPPREPVREPPAFEPRGAAAGKKAARGRRR